MKDGKVCKFIWYLKLLCRNYQVYKIFFTIYHNRMQNIARKTRSGIHSGKFRRVLQHVNVSREKSFFLKDITTAEFLNSRFL